MNNNNPLVSIIVRTKDRPKLLKRALESIAAQTYRPIEVVLVNDGGCDLDIEEIKGIFGDVSLNYIRLEKNTGRAHAGNVGIENARGEYIGFLDDDDEFYPNHVSSLVSFLENNLGYSGAYSDSEIVRRQYNARGEIVEENNEGPFKSSDFSYAVLLFENYITLICSLLKRDVVSHVGGFDESFAMFEDWDLYIRVSQQLPLHHVPLITTKYVQWDATHQIAFADHPDARSYYLSVLAKHLDKISPDVIYNYFGVKQSEINQLWQTRDTKKALEQQITASNAELDALRAELDKKIRELEAVTKKYEEEAVIRDSERENLGRDNEALGVANQNLRETLAAKDWYIKEIEDSFSWRLIGFYRKKIKRFVFPPGTRWERVYRHILKGVLVFHTKGAKVTLGKFREKFRQRLASKKLRREKFFLPSLRENNRETINNRVSVVIPTKNAGAEFRGCLERIRNQHGLKEIEIIVVDSGSTDRTLDIANRYQAKVVNIRPEDFNHGRVRNIGAGEATGDYIIFMSQDVVAAGLNCFYDLIRIMEKDDLIAAASVKQIPRSDADVFACWQLWYYYNKVLNLTSDHISSLDPKTLGKISPEERRKASQIDNIFSCVKKNVFDSFKFNPLPYAEDLDLGLRLISGGYKIAFFSSVAAIHSHNRDASYYFRRSFVDIKSIAYLLGFEPISWADQGIRSSEDIFSCIYAFYLKVSSAVSMCETLDLQDRSVENVIDMVKYWLRNNDASGVPGGDESLNRLLTQIVPEESFEFRQHRGEDILLGQYTYLLDSLGDFLAIDGSIEWKKGEFVRALYKVFAVVGGSNLGNYAVYCDKSKVSEDSFERTFALLGMGV